jgi:hypothetical protein
MWWCLCWWLEGAKLEGVKLLFYATSDVYSTFRREELAGEGLMTENYEVFSRKTVVWLMNYRSLVERNLNVVYPTFVIVLASPWYDVN